MCLGLIWRMSHLKLISRKNCNRKKFHISTLWSLVFEQTDKYSLTITEKMSECHMSSVNCKLAHACAYFQNFWSDQVWHLQYLKSKVYLILIRSKYQKYCNVWYFTRCKSSTYFGLFWHWNVSAQLLIDFRGLV